jgi:hypothetical protein
MQQKNIFKNEADQPSLVQFALRVIPKLIFFLIKTVLCLPLWPVYWLGCMVWYRPPNVPYLKQVLRYLRHTWTVSPKKTCSAFLWPNLVVLIGFL